MLHLHQRDGRPVQHGEGLTVVGGDPGQHTPLSERSCLVGGECESRDVVQPCAQRQERVFKAARLSDFVQFVQRNRLIERERPRLRAAQMGDVRDGAERQRDVAREAADIGALRDEGRKGDFFKLLPVPGRI